MEAARWEHFEHGADVGIRGIGKTKEQAFEQAALAMTAAITDPAGVAAAEVVQIACDASDDELLLLEWLNALVFEMATRRLLFSRFAVQLAGGRLAGRAWGETVNVARHQPAVEVKGATLTCVRVQQNTSGEWLAQCVVDV